MALLDIRHLARDETQPTKPHTHAEGQLFTVQSGLVAVLAGGGHWVMPPGCIGWVPPFVAHGAENHGEMQGMSLYFDEAWSRRHMPDRIKVVRLTPLLTALLDEAAQSDSQISALPEPYWLVLGDALRRLPAESWFLPMPTDPRLAGMASHLWRQPDEGADLDGWAQRLGMARRTLTRRFQQQTGLSVGQWRQQLRLLLALEKLAAGAPVTTLALELGYQSLSAFIAMFRRYLGTSPTAWLSSGRSLRRTH